ncbi:Atu4866 domain-containing protein [Bosea sp. PAMC 26642]|uniref:Atu4866 domain-containing protein n=1 Tax=Bosea sp. (strain PAMC 26642) TaxID=1792307 RepID=UPI00076FF361|nr:Atu4866 domain-containing protein [Bosea sp. PAMC 26642]AMJ62177.1 hypothetical protein AXW83_19430 [Bosea sp. PAMC 26642]
MPFSQVLQALSTFSASIVPAARPPRPLEIDFDMADAASPFERAAIGTWVTEDGAIHLHLQPDGRYDKAKSATPARYRGRYEVDRSKLYFEDDSGLVALGRMGRGTLEIGEKRFRKAA